jgi:hypothetical protein
MQAVEPEIGEILCKNTTGVLHLWLSLTSEAYGVVLNSK